MLQALLVGFERRRGEFKFLCETPSTSHDRQGVEQAALKEFAFS